MSISVLEPASQPSLLAAPRAISHVSPPPALGAGGVGVFPGMHGVAGMGGLSSMNFDLSGMVGMSVPGLGIVPPSVAAAMESEEQQAARTVRIGNLPAVVRCLT
jgi:hypothetical protein